MNDQLFINLCDFLLNNIIDSCFLNVKIFWFLYTVTTFVPIFPHLKDPTTKQIVEKITDR